jgi:hypothetical protein
MVGTHNGGNGERGMIALVYGHPRPMSGQHVFEHLTEHALVALAADERNDPMWR